MTTTSPESGIIRTVKDRNHPYKLMNTTFANDERLSWEARGLMAYLLEKPDDWQVRFSDLLKKAPDCKRYKLRGILRELEKCGYLIRERVRREHGRFDWVSTVYEVPQHPTTIGQKLTPGEKQPDPTGTGSAPGVNSPPVVEPPAVRPPVENRPIYRVINTTNYESREGGASAPRATPAAPKITDPNQLHPACLLYRELTGYRPNKANAQLIAQHVTPDALEQWRAVVEAWLRRGNRYSNVEGMLDWYQQGVPDATHRYAQRDRGRARPSADRAPSRPLDLDNDI